MEENFHNKRIFITGGAGFIGTRLARRLLGCSPKKIVLFDNFTRNALERTELQSSEMIEVVSGDVLDIDALRNAMKNADYVVHAAAIAGIDSVIRDPVTTLRVNILGTANVLQLSAELGIRDRVVCFSTSEVFGTMAMKPSEDSDSVSGSAGEARWSYAVSKLAGEHLARAYFTQHNVPTVVVRPFNVYGPGQVGEGAISVFVKRAIEELPLYINGDGDQIRSWCYIDDFIDCLILCMTNVDAVGHSFHIGNPRATMTTLGLAQTVCRVINSSSRIEFRPPLSADIQLRIPSVAKARELLGFQARIELEEGIRKTADWIKRCKDK